MGSLEYQPWDDPEFSFDNEDGSGPHNGDMSSCAACAGSIYYLYSPYGGWWIHNLHPEDGHDAQPKHSTDGK
jgi:hypothetical protein